MFGFLHWTPDVFWKMSFPEYIAVMKGVTTIEDEKARATKGGKRTGQRKADLTKGEINALKDMLDKEKQKE